MNKNMKLIVVLIVLSLLYFLTTRDESSTKLDKNFTNLNSETITKLEITKDSTITLVKENNVWMIDDYKANQSFVTNALNEVKNITLSRKVTSNSEKHATYEVDEKGVKITLTGEEETSFILGKNAASYQNVFIRRPNEDDVFTTTKNFKNNFDRTINDWKDKTILSIKKEEIASLSINDQLFLTNHDSLVMIKGTKTSEKEVEANSTGLSLFNKFSYFNTLDFPFIAKASLKKDLTISVNEKDGDTHSIIVYTTGSDDSKRFVTVNKNKTLFEMPNTTFDTFRKSYKDLKK